jgi:DNA mismatch endonuclease (patch repair protein)
MRAVRSKETSAELSVRRILRDIGETGYRLHRADLPGTPDVAFIGRRKAIFVNGCFWHGHDCRRGSRVPKTNRDYWTAKISRNVQRDEENRRALEKMDWGVCVVWECELRDPAMLNQRLVSFLSQ